MKLKFRSLNILLFGATLISSLLWGATLTTKAKAANDGMPPAQSVVIFTQRQNCDGSLNKDIQTVKEFVVKDPKGKVVADVDYGMQDGPVDGFQSFRLDAGIYTITAVLRPGRDWVPVSDFQPQDPAQSALPGFVAVEMAENQDIKLGAVARNSIPCPVSAPMVTTKWFTDEVYYHDFIYGQVVIRNTNYISQDVELHGSYSTALRWDYCETQATKRVDIISNELTLCRIPAHEIKAAGAPEMGIITSTLTLAPGEIVTQVLAFDGRSVGRSLVSMSVEWVGGPAIDLGIKEIQVISSPLPIVSLSMPQSVKVGEEFQLNVTITNTRDFGIAYNATLTNTVPAATNFRPQSGFTAWLENPSGVFRPANPPLVKAGQAYQWSLMFFAVSSGPQKFQLCASGLDTLEAPKSCVSTVINVTGEICSANAQDGCQPEPLEAVFLPWINK